MPKYTHTLSDIEEQSVFNETSFYLVEHKRNKKVIHYLNSLIGINTKDTSVLTLDKLLSKWVEQ